jgi:coproporphyrinogen III oxidase-like Fe-S oxidoreductase
VAAGRTAVVARKCLTERERMQYDLFMRLFGLALPKRIMEQKYGAHYQRRLWTELLALRLLGAVQDDGQTYRLTRRGLYYWVVIMREFFNGVNHFRAQMRERATQINREKGARHV